MRLENIRWKVTKSAKQHWKGTSTLTNRFLWSYVRVLERHSNDKDTANEVYWLEEWWEKGFADETNEIWDVHTRHYRSREYYQRKPWFNGWGEQIFWIA